MNPKTLDHVAYWLADRDAVADFALRHLGMHVIDRTDKFTLVGADARRGKLTLFEADGPRERGVLERIGLRVSGAAPQTHELPDGLVLSVVDGDDTLDHVLLRSPDPDAAARDW